MKDLDPFGTRPAACRIFLLVTLFWHGADDQHVDSNRSTVQSSANIK